MIKISEMFTMKDKKFQFQTEEEMKYDLDILYEFTEDYLIIEDGFVEDLSVNSCVISWNRIEVLIKVKKSNGFAHTITWKVLEESTANYLER
jgi:hypothetical protein